jgi:hypothetical protein
VACNTFRPVVSAVPVRRSHWTDRLPWHESVRRPAFITPTGRATQTYFFFAAFLAFFFEALAALRFFAMSVTSFLDKILHARRTLSKEILTTTRNQDAHANIVALSAWASENNTDTQRHVVAQTRRPCADKRARVARRHCPTAVRRRGVERASTANRIR